MIKKLLSILLELHSSFPFIAHVNNLSQSARFPILFAKLIYTTSTHQSQNIFIPTQLV
jgi:hypothetical protein